MADPKKISLILLGLPLLTIIILAGCFNKNITNSKPENKNKTEQINNCQSCSEKNK